MKAVLDHVAIAVKDLEASLAFFRDALGLHVEPPDGVAFFGPVISIMRTKTVDEAIAIENANPYGNAASVFTQNGGIARYIIDRASAGMIGVNVGVPVPREPFSFGGWNESKFGVGDITGKSSIEFWTKLKKPTMPVRAGKKKFQKPLPLSNFDGWLRIGPSPFAATIAQTNSASAANGKKNALKISSFFMLSTPR